ncbi:MULTISPECIES: transporter substrate-binding domain-containing protein [unclassified Marinomonas]|uniref:transporter substrate-binding domain-containing protein n=1 Tax=unclassified Marinomonas TaxID=196814 RepID=UPI0007AF6B2C|nr:MULTISPECIES: transporter substrate-binding domain-containing protein [unclassified Marinomonas]
MMLRTLINLFLFALLFAISGLSSQLYADTLSQIQDREVIRIGVKVDYPPWGMLSPEGDIVGFEPDLAALVAKELGVKAKLRSVTSGNRFQLLEEGEVDMLIATVGDTQQRRERVSMITPHYYRSGVTALTAKSSNIKNWSDLSGEKVCLYGGSYFNKTLIQDYQIEPLILFNTRDAQLALLTKKCVAWAYDNSAIYHLLKSDSWKDYQAELPIIYPILWSLVVNKDLDSLSLKRKLESITVKWQRDATLYKYATKWLLPDRAYLADRTKLWNQKTDRGDYLCRFNADYHLPEACDQYPKDKPVENNYWWPFDQHDTNWLILAFTQTLLFTLAVVILTLVFAYIFTLFSLLSNPYIRKTINSIINVQRSVPPIVLLYLLYFGLFSYHYSHPLMLDLLSGGAVTTALIVLSLYTAAGISSLLEDAIASQNKRRQLSTLNTAFLEGKHGIIANLINLVKASAMASALSVPNAILVTTSLVASQGHTLFLMTLLMLFYFFEVMLFSKTIEYLFRLIPQAKRPQLEN